MLVEALVAEAAVEALHEGVLDRPARLDEVQMYAVLVGPEVEGLAGELGAELWVGGSERTGVKR